MPQGKQEISDVGTEDLASYLITTPAGSILIETGVESNGDRVARNIATLGFKVTDVKYLLTTQAHFDHVGGHARMKQVSGAKIIVSEADADRGRLPPRVCRAESTSL